MPALAIPPELKKITSYIRRAEELDKAATAANASPESRLVAYYLRQYAVQQGIPLAATSSAAKTCLGHILAALETEKAAMDNFTKEEAGFLCRQFAQKIFDKADLEDRDGAATKETARTFYAAATFWQILEQFTSGSDQGDEEAAEVATEDRKRIVYAKWKATEILKALKEGRTPTPGGYGQDDGSLPMDEDDEDNNKGGASNTDETVPAVTPVQDSDADEEILMPPPPAPSQAPSPPAVPQPPASPPPVVPPPPPSSEEGTEVGLDGAVDTNSTMSDDPPPPAYPGPAAATGRSRPPVNFDLPPAVPPPPPQPPVKPVVPPPPAAAAPKPQPPTKPSTGWFGRGNNSNNNNAGGKLTKAQWTDAMELTRFAMAALEDKNADVAAQRLQQALQTLGR